MIIDKINKIRKIGKEIKEEKHAMKLLPQSLPLYDMTKTRIKYLKKERIKIIRGKS